MTNLKNQKEAKMTKAYLLSQLGEFKEVRIINQNNCKIFFEYGVILQSYNKIIAIRFISRVKDKNLKYKVILGRYYKYSKTVSKYRNKFLEETSKQIEEKLKNNTYIYLDELQ